MAQGVLVGAVMLVFGTPSQSQSDLTPQVLPPAPAPAGEWRVSIGAGALLSPDYLGSDRYSFSPLLSPDIRWREDTLFLSLRDGLGATLLRHGNVSMGLVLRPRFGRDQDDNDALRGMGDVRAAGEGGAFLRYADPNWRGSLELRQGFGGHSGLVADARLDRVLRLRPDIILAAGPRLSWGSEDFAETYFGVDAEQARRTGYARFAPQDYWFAGVAASLTLVLDSSWSVTAFGEVGRILGDAADSPLVDGRGNATQGVLGLAVGWQFTR
ncbi:MipA/OmpV family protein [Falsiroseomonas sp. E2-1-a20]|uniref:MipA/OmpV family protein n=1 Tax=Falsiroseomonas sp. E2-1-a20 TaxID=3239300 RepID=UPI003F39A906